ncbi:MAG TPA: DUF1376 domain-containing protein [Reyranella sp.]|jgi:uncharacterized protein YdaU (DUF1376 family)|nr:DUF1376 domain-containing protein [Reyranella sp.]
MARLPYLQLWVGDFMADTQHLDCRETGALLLLLFAAWTSPAGGLPDDDRQLARLARCTAAEWRRLREAVLAFWHRGEDGLWHQKRLDEERRSASQKTSAARLSANARWLKNKQTQAADAMPAQRVRTAHQSQSHIQSHKDHESAPGVRAPGEGAPAAGLRLDGPDGIWKLRLLGHRPGAAWKPEHGPAPESGEDNPNLDPGQRLEWRRYWGIA